MSVRSRNASIRSDAVSSLFGIGATAASIAAPSVVAISFEDKMKRLQALTNAAESEAGVLKETILELGKKSQFTSSQTADAAQFLAMAEFDVRKIRLFSLNGGV